MRPAETPPAAPDGTNEVGKKGDLETQALAGEALEPAFALLSAGGGLGSGPMMYTESLLPRLEDLARRAAAPEGVDVAWVEFKPEGAAWFLRVYIDRQGAGVSLADCQRVSERLSVLLDVEDPIESTYTLEVSSPGLDRPLWREQDYVRFSGRLVRIKTREAPEGVPGQKNFRGRLAGVQGGAVLLERREGRVAIPLSLIEQGRLEVEVFPRAGQGPAQGARKRS